MASEKDNRVLSRRAARIVTTEEAMTVTGYGGPRTETVCTFRPGVGADGDTFLGEC